MLNLPVLSSGPDRTGAPRTRGIGVERHHMHVFVLQPECILLTRHNPGVAPPPPAHHFGGKLPKKLQAAIYLHWICRGGGKLDVVIPASGNIFRPTGLMVGVFLLGKGVF